VAVAALDSAALLICFMRGEFFRRNKRGQSIKQR
jgi:hypothetical protein